MDYASTTSGVGACLIFDTYSLITCKACLLFFEYTSSLHYSCLDCRDVHVGTNSLLRQLSLSPRLLSSMCASWSLLSCRL